MNMIAFRKWLCGFLSLTLLLGMAGCGRLPRESEPVPGESSRETASSAGTETVDASLPTVTQPSASIPSEPAPTEPVPSDPAPTETKPMETEPTEPPITLPSETEPVHTHSYTVTVVAPTCTEVGYTLHRCSCGDSFRTDQTPMADHQYKQFEYLCPDPESDGFQSFRCEVCGDTYREVLPSFDGNEVAAAVVKYINRFRAEAGSTQLTYLPGMSQVAQYRSVQLVTNFAHDTDDLREATAYYQYGEYIDWAEYGCPELVDQNYYDAHVGEAIGHVGSGYPTTDDTGYSIAAGFRNSAGHWQYLSSTEYSYIGVGCTYSNGSWYVCVLVGTTNFG